MVALLNYLPYIIIALGFYVGYRVWRKNGVDRHKQLIVTGITTFVLLLVLQVLTAGYIPKNRASNVGIGMPEFEQSEAQVENRLRSPALDSKASEEKVKEMSDWRKDKVEREKKMVVDEVNRLDTDNEHE